MDDNYYNMVHIDAAFQKPDIGYLLAAQQYFDLFSYPALEVPSHSVHVRHFFDDRGYTLQLVRARD